MEEAASTDKYAMERAVDAIQLPTSSISFKMRNLFYLRSLESPEGSLCVQKCLGNESVLQDHEVAYILGQMKQPNSVDFLLALAGSDANVIVRHEAIEALRNFEDTALIPKLEKFIDDENAIISESAILALQKLREGDKNAKQISRYGSRDPAFPFRGDFETAIDLFTSGNIVEKYRAIFHFRDLNSKEAVDILARGFRDPSDLLRHEVAFVLGQMENEHAVDALIDVLDNSEEKDIARHEAAEALGNIGTGRCIKCLEKYLDSDIQILRESAHVGLEISSFDKDEYLNV